MSARIRLATAAAALFLGSVGALLPTAAQAAPAGGCWNNGCSGLDPAAYCQGDAVTVASAAIGPAVLELRYSDSCEAIWARISQAKYEYPGDNSPGHAKVIRNSDGASYTCSVPLGGTSCYTRMLGDHNVTSYAYGDFDRSPYQWSGRTGSY
ncbi:DUF2690 domain-containing protein [Streptomyces sp. NPDC006487]|uniref:DUF2690 domain-containing protein n=1 Tax=Streptomyces sp. NPDC006487 TaxID=3364748 RepID=UPI003688A670